MSVETPLENEVFTVRTYKSLYGYDWANTYELQVTDASVGRQGLEQAALAIVNAERVFHFTTVNFTRAVVSSYVPDSRPYNPSAFMTINLSLYGQRSRGNSEVLTLHECVFVRFNAATGRAGKRFYRGCLTEGDVDAVQVAYFINETVRNNIQVAMGQVVPNPAAGVRMVLARGAPQPNNIRSVEFVTVAELSVNRKVDHRYFDFPNR